MTTCARFCNYVLLDEHHQHTTYARTNTDEKPFSFDPKKKERKKKEYQMTGSGIVGGKNKRGTATALDRMS